MFEGVVSRLRSMTGHSRKEELDTRLILPPGPPPFLLSHLSTHHMRGMTLPAATESVRKMDRASLLAMIDSMVRAKNGLKWEVQIGKGSSPGRVDGQLISNNNELYMLGGVPTKYFFNLPGVYTNNWNKREGFLMRLDSKTHRWQSEGDAELSQQAWSQNQYMTVIGSVCQDKLYVVCKHGWGSTDVGEDDMHIFDFCKKEWNGLKLSATPPPVVRPFLSTYGTSLLQFGGELGRWQSGDWVQPKEALWSFDTEQQEWRHRRPSGSLPSPEFSCGMCVIEDQAFVLVNHPSNQDPDGHMDIYVLDLQAWHWTRLPPQTDAPPCLTNITPVVVQGHWLVTGGTCYAPEDELLYDFKFATSSWSRAELTGRSMLRLTHYQAVCHQSSLLVMGGVQWEDEHDHGKASHTVHTISPQYTAPTEDGPDTTSMRYELGSDLRDLFQQRQFTDLTLEVDGRNWQVHRVVLGSCSPFLKQLMQGRPASGDPLVLTGLEAEGMGLLIDWAYGNYKQRLGYKQRLSLLHASHRLQVHDLMCECERALKSSVNSETYPLLTDVARELNCQELEQACAAFLERMESSSDTVEAAEELVTSIDQEQTVSQASSSRPASPSQDPPASPGPSDTAAADSTLERTPLVLEIDPVDPDLDWDPSDDAVSDAETVQQSPGIGAKNIAVPQPSGSTRECNCFPMDVNDSDEEDYDDDDDSNEEEDDGDEDDSDDVSVGDDDSDFDDDSEFRDDDMSSVHEMEDDCISKSQLQLPDLAEAPFAVSSPSDLTAPHI